MAYFNALVIKKNNDLYLDPTTLKAGVMQLIPTPDSGGRIDGDWWATPIADYGVVTGFNFTPTSPTALVGPTAQSFHVFRLINAGADGTNDVWWVRGTSTLSGDSPALPGYAEVAADWDCCAAVKRTLPTTTTAIAPCAELCYYNSGTSYGITFTVPTLVGNQRLYAYGYYNNILLTALSPTTGFTSAAALLSAIQSNWATTTDGQSLGTWTGTATTITLTQGANASGANQLCVYILAVNPSAS